MELRAWKGGLAWGMEIEGLGGCETGGCAIEMGVEWGAGPGPGVVGTEEESVGEGLGFSTTHILGECQLKH